MSLRDNLLMMLDEAISVVYESEDAKDFEKLPDDLQRIIDALEQAAATVRREL